jgi:2-iminobutanoate/2-iminopropanoate deaminase
MNYIRYFLTIFFNLFLFSNTMSIAITKISTENAPQARGPYSQAIRAGDFLFISGQLGLDPKTGRFVSNTIHEQAKQVLENIGAILQAAGATFEQVVKVEVYLKNLNNLQIMNKIYAEYFWHDTKPSRQAMQVAKLPFDALIEISCVAYIPEK